MRRWEKALAIAGGALLLLGAFLLRRAALPKSDVEIVSGDCHTPATIIEPPAGVNALGSAVLLHGLGANRRTMTFLGMDFAAHGFRSYLLDLAGHGDNTDGFTFAKAQRCADAAVESLIRDGKIDRRRTVLLGHSMGGAIAIRMADVEPLPVTIALSPAPMENPRRMPANLLVFSGGYELAPLRRQAQALAAAAGGTRATSQDFAEQRAFELRVLPHAAHTSTLMDRGVAHQSEEWVMRAFFPGVDEKTIALDLDLATYDTYRRGRLRLGGAVLGLLGLALLFPASATFSAVAAGRIGGKRSAQEPTERPAFVLAMVEEAVCALGSVLILSIFVPLKFIHLYSGDYFASLLLLSGMLMLALNWRYAKRHLSLEGRTGIAGGVLGVALILSVGAWFNWQLGDLWLNSTRWLRFALLLPFLWIFSFAEEAVLGPVLAGARRMWRFMVFLLMRLELWLACVVAYYMLGSGQALIGVLVAGLAAFSILQRLAVDAFRLRTRSATAAATFGAILAAWFIAAVFPLR